MRPSILTAARLLCSVAFASTAGLCLAANANGCVPAPAGAVAWWNFEEGNGSTVLDRAGAHDGVLEGQPLRTSGEVGAGIRFTGGNWATIPDSPDWTFGTNNFTIELWAAFDTAQSGSISEPGHVLIGCDEGGGDRNKWIFAFGGGMLEFHVNGPGIGPWFFPKVPFDPVVGAWYHLGLVRQGTAFTIYTNGVAAASAESPIVFPDPAAPLTIGQAENLGYVRGTLDEMAIYHRALSPAELGGIHAAGSAGRCTPLTIRPDRNGADGVRFSWLGASGMVYVVEGTARLGIDPWKAFREVTSSGGETQVDLQPDGATIFYRLRILLPVAASP